MTSGPGPGPGPGTPPQGPGGRGPAGDGAAPRPAEEGWPIGPPPGGAFGPRPGAPGSAPPAGPAYAPGPGYGGGYGAGGSPLRPALPPLTDLPDPQPVTWPDAREVQPDHILVDSTVELRRRIWRTLPSLGAAIALWWFVMVAMYLFTASPFIMLLLPMFALVGENIGAVLGGVGISVGGGLALQFLLPLLGVAAAAALVPVSAAWAGRVNPRRFRTEEGFRTEVARRASLPLHLPAVLLLAIVVLGTAVDLRGVAWGGFTSGVIGTICMAASVIMLMHVHTRRILGNADLMRLPPVWQMRTRAAQATGPARVVLSDAVETLDRRPVPPQRLDSARIALQTLLLTGEVLLRRVIPVTLPLIACCYWFSEWTQIADSLAQMTGPPDTWTFASGSDFPALGLPLTVVGIGLVALVQAIVLPVLVRSIASSPQGIRDQRFYLSPTERAARNDAERRMVNALDLLATVSASAVAVVSAFPILLLRDGLVITGMVICGLTAILIYRTGMRGIGRDRLRDLLHGSFDRTGKRPVAPELVAPVGGRTRAQLERDPYLASRRAAENPAEPIDSAARSGRLPDLGVETEKKRPEIPVEGEQRPGDIPRGL